MFGIRVLLTRGICRDFSARQEILGKKESVALRRGIAHTLRRTFDLKPQSNNRPISKNAV